jgi:hypothetical protein
MSHRNSSSRLRRSIGMTSMGNPWLQMDPRLSFDRTGDLTYNAGILSKGDY